jgi:hypothetical protein
MIVIARQRFCMRILLQACKLTDSLPSVFVYAYIWTVALSLLVQGAAVSVSDSANWYSAAAHRCAL